MARERISLVPEEVKQETSIRQQILEGDINPETFAKMPADEQGQVNKILFQMASEKIEPNQGTSTIEFILFAFMRIANKKLNGMSLTADDQEVERTLNEILSMHEITNDTPKANWLFDYVLYAEMKAHEFLENRKEHIERRLKVTGEA